MTKKRKKKRKSKSLLWKLASGKPRIPKIKIKRIKLRLKDIS